MNNQYQLHTASQENKNAWNDYLNEKGVSPGFSAFQWRDILSDCYQIQQRHFFVCDDSQQIKGVLPTYIVTDTKKNKQLFSYRQGMVADDQEAALLLVNAAKHYATENGAISAEISSAADQPSFNLECHRVEKKAIWLDLTMKEEELWKSMRDKTRNAIRKGEKHNLKIKQDLSQLKTFYNIYSSRMAKKSVTFHSLNFFKALISHFKNQCEIYIAYYQNKPIGGMLVIYSGSAAAYSYGGMVAGYEKYCCNQFLLWHITQQCYQKNIHMLDLGEASIGSGVYKFKIWFGGTPKPVHYYNLLKQSEPKKPKTKTSPKVSFRGRLYHFALEKSPTWLKKIALLKMKKFNRLI